MSAHGDVAPQMTAGVAEAEVYVNDQAFERLDDFESAERAARGGRLGVWGACGGDFHRRR